MMIRAIIIDDEQHCSDRLISLLRQDYPSVIKVEGSFLSVGEGLKAIHDLHPELIFLDVQLGDQNGFDLLKRLYEINFEIIFTTAYDKYAVQAFKFSAVDYLLKPVDKDDLKMAIGRLSDKMDKKYASGKIEALIHNLSAASKWIGVPVMTGLVFIRWLQWSNHALQ
jgi:two-component system LytT family response regulator